VSKRKPEISRRDFVGVSIGAVVVAGIGCGSNDKQSAAAGGQAGVGGNSPGVGGTSSGAGGASTGAGGASTGAGGASTGAGGASTGAGGDATGGASIGAGGASTGAGGASTGGASTSAGGASTGGKAGTSTGGAATGGTTSAGGASTGGKAGTSTGGAATGGKSGAGGTVATGGSTGKGSTATGGTSATTGGASATGGTTGASTVSAKLVGLVRNTDLPTATLRAIELAGGLPPLAGRTVLLKPNLLTATASPCTPNPEVVRGVLQAVKAAGATKILIGDGTMSGSAVSVMSSVGIHAVNQAEATGGVTITEVNFSTTTNVKPSGATSWTSGIDVYNDLLDDGSGNKPYIINIACCKHHGITVWTMVMKNWYGCVPSSGRKHVNSGTARQAQIPEIHLAIKEDFVVLDATKAYLTQGPSSGDLASPGIVVASADAVAAEATGLCILRQYRSAAGSGKDDIENQKIFNTDNKTTMGRALTLGNGWITTRSQYTYAAEGLGADETSIMGQLDL
jgi:uncharacterized protein (DUF362 family)